MRCTMARVASWIAAGVVALSVVPAQADSNKEVKPAAGKSSAEEQKAMMEAWAKLAAVNENHKLLEGMVGTWKFHIKMWMDPSAPPQESDGTEVVTALMGGRYVESHTTGTMEMPGADGKPVSTPFIGMGITGYDNMKKKFVSSWMDNMGTGILMSEGTYDAATKTFTYTSEMDDVMAPGTKIPIREVVKVLNPGSHVFEWYETRGGKEMRTMEITYMRVRKK